MFISTAFGPSSRTRFASASLAAASSGKKARNRDDNALADDVNIGATTEGFSLCRAALAPSSSECPLNNFVIPIVEQDFRSVTFIINNE